MNKRIPTAICAALLVTACATAYQKQSFTGGFDETQLQPNVYRVTFKGNGYTSAERAADYALLRCAELTLQNGFAYFAIVEAGEGATTGSFTTPTQSYTTGSATAYGSGRTVNAYGQSTTTTYGGQTFHFSKPSSSNTILMVNSKDEVNGMVYDARFLYGSLSSKYGIAAK
ncbi:MAG: hypothetical protein U1F41_03060 [Burkholderiales bacterium]